MLTTEVSQNKLPAGVESYYEESGATEEVKEVKSTGDLDSLNKDLDNASVDVDTDLGRLDKDFSNF